MLLPSRSSVIVESQIAESSLLNLALVAAVIQETLVFPGSKCRPIRPGCFDPRAVIGALSQNGCPQNGPFVARCQRYSCAELRLGPMPGTARDGLSQKWIRRSFVTDSGWFRVTTNKLVVVTKRHDFCGDTIQ